MLLFLQLLGQIAAKCENTVVITSASGLINLGYYTDFEMSPWDNSLYICY